jgi:hypothetical protein
LHRLSIKQACLWQCLTPYVVCIYW